MITFQYARANDVRDAVNRIADDPNAKFVAGGTNLIDLMKMDVERPTKVIDITRLPLKQVENMPNGGLRIGALVRNTDLAYHPIVEQRYPVLASAIMAGASQQLRNMASTGRQPLAAYALPLLLRRSDALQQTRAGHWLLGDRRPQSHARDPRQQ
jgi:xanthine dehydrogenase YagS FAD-binding subunit